MKFRKSILKLLIVLGSFSFMSPNPSFGAMEDTMNMMSNMIMMQMMAGGGGAAEAGGGNPMYCMMGFSALQNAVSNVFEGKRLTEEPFTPIGGASDPNPSSPNLCPTGSESCQMGATLFNGLKDGKFSEEEASDISQLLGCSEPCVELDSEGQIKSIKTPSGVKVDKSTADLSNLSPSGKAALAKAMDDFRSENQDFLDEMEESKDGLNAKRLVGNFQSGRGEQAYVAGNTNNKRSNTKPPDFQKQFKNLFSKFKKKKLPAAIGKPVTVGKDKVGSIQENIFLMVSRRYQERKAHKRFIENKRRHSKSSKKLI